MQNVTQPLTDSKVFNLFIIDCTKGRGFVAFWLSCLTLKKCKFQTSKLFYFFLQFFRVKSEENEAVKYY